MEPFYPTLFPMKIVSWNCRGAGKPSFVMVAKDLIRTHRPNICAIFETHLSESNSLKVVRRLGYSNWFCVESAGLSGGIWLLWNEADIVVEATAVSRSAIHAVITPKFGEPWILSSVYVSPHSPSRKKPWDEMKLVADMDSPYAAIGDFNAITSPQEKKGGQIPSYSQLNDFISMIRYCGLIDVNAAGPKYTWTNKQTNGQNIQERLDRTLVNEKWRMQFPEAKMFLEK